MLKKIQTLLLGVVLVGVVVLSTVLMIGPNGMIARAQGDTSIISPAYQNIPEHSLPEVEPITNNWPTNMRLAYQAVITDGTNFLESGQLEPVGDLETAILGTGLHSGAIGSQSTGSGVEWVPTSALRHDGDNSNGFRFWPFSGYVRNTTASLMCLSGPVYLPDGATLSRFAMFFVDDSPSIIESRLFRKDIATPTNSAEEIARILFASIDDSTLYVGTTTSFFPAGAEVVSNNYGYYIGFCFGPSTGIDQRIYGYSLEHDFVIPPTVLGSNF